jgi:hypothetical protein
LLSAAAESLVVELGNQVALQALMNPSEPVVVDWHLRTDDAAENATLLQMPGILALHWEDSPDLLMTTDLHESLVTHNAQAVALSSVTDGAWHHIAVQMQRTTLSSQAAVANQFSVVNGTVNSDALALELVIDGQQAAQSYIELRRELSEQSITQAFGDKSTIVLASGIACAIDQLRVWLSPGTNIAELAHVAVVDEEDMGELAAFVSFDGTQAAWPELQEHTGKSRAFVTRQEGTNIIASNLVPSGASFGAPFVLLLLVIPLNSNAWV